jgi:hypothetical protein
MYDQPTALNRKIGMTMTNGAMHVATKIRLVETVRSGMSM